MRIVIDMQGAQAENRNRGIGRYTMAIANAIVRNRGDHEIILALNGMFSDTIEPIRAIFDGLLPQENIRIWYAVSPVAENSTVNIWRRESAELVREAFLESLNPDFVYVSSLFEGFNDDAVTSVRKLSGKISTAVTLYDLIPYIHRSPYLDNSELRNWYLRKIEQLRKADLLLAISESSRQEGIEHLNFHDEQSVNISTDADANFYTLKISAENRERIQRKYGLKRPFVMYTGGIDHRKNIEGLIAAYAKLPVHLRSEHQLSIVCSVQPETRRKMEQFAAKEGLGEDEVVLTGFVPEEDLVALYNLCTLFVFPSWHEGFGLPVLEAMRCGAPVIGAHSSSLPEVIGYPEALFDPHSDDAIAQAMERALTDESFRSRLIEHGKKQAKNFSWDKSAKRAIAAMEHMVATRQKMSFSSLIEERQPKLAYVSPLPPERSGISDYSAELLPELARYYDIDVIVAQDKVSDAWVNGHCAIRSIKWFVEHAGSYERVIYHFGNSHFHQHMFELLQAVPGVVVLHDFYLSGVLYHMEAYGYSPECWTQELYYSHGYAALAEQFHSQDVGDVIWKYPCCQSVIQQSIGMIAHSPNTLRLATQWYGNKGADWKIIPLLREPQVNKDRVHAREALDFAPGDFLVCTFGVLGPMKLNQRLLDAWSNSRLAKNKDCHLVFVGEKHPGAYGEELVEAISRCGTEENIHITGWVDTEVFRYYLAAADVGVQLRTLSRGETSAAVLDCMNYGLATIVNANGSMADLDEDAVWMLPDKFTDEQLITALESLWENEELRHRKGVHARKTILDKHNPLTCASKYRDAIEHFYSADNAQLGDLVSAISKISANMPDNNELISLAELIARNFPAKSAKSQLLVDISELIQRDTKTGIQRVVRSILKEWLEKPPANYRIEPVYATVNHRYRYARRFVSDFLDLPSALLQDEPIDYAPGDIFFGLDLQPEIITAQRPFYQELRRQGVQVIFAVYDLLCVQMPQFFVPGASEGFTRWLEVVTESDGAVCISKAVADELAGWIEKNAPHRLRSFQIEWFHLGADVSSSAPSKGMPAEADRVLGHIRSRISVIMVGTLEPRKGHEQVLDAFEELWQSGKDINLVIIGKQGWLAEKIIKRLYSHPELNKRLFWLDGISDEYLEKLYAASACLIAASYGEGFGLPLIEATQHKLPIIARDIPVFQEVAGEHAFYFTGEDAGSLAAAVTDWLLIYEKGDYPKSDDMPWLTWKESAKRLSDVILGNNSRYKNKPDEESADIHSSEDVVAVNKKKIGMAF